MKRATKAEGIRRLHMLADYVERQPEENFDMRSWYNHHGADHDHGVKADKPLTAKQITACGTTACALGHCAVSPLGKKLGMSMVYDPETDEAEVRLKGSPSLDAFDIAEQVFGISSDDAEFLFGGDESLTPKEWAKRCRYFADYGRDENEPQF